LTQSQCACNGLIFDARIPLWLDDKDTVCRCEVQAFFLSAYVSCAQSSILCCSRENSTHPKAPVPVVMMSTGNLGFVAKSSRILCRRGSGHPPSILSKGIERWSRCLAIKSSVLVQQEKIMLHCFSKIPCARSVWIDLPFCFPHVLFDVRHKCCHFRGMTLRAKVTVLTFFFPGKAVVNLT
jgi:hypothetical protein